MRVRLFSGGLQVGLAATAYFALTTADAAPSAPAPTKAAKAAPPASEQDPLFQQPYIDKDEMRDAPVNHRYMHGGFKGTDTRFSFYSPAKTQYQDRFFRYVTAVPDSENLSPGATGEEDKISFSIASGAHFIETNGGGAASSGSRVDSMIAAYRTNATHRRDVEARNQRAMDAPYKILLMMKRRPDMSVAAFRDYYETHHVPLVSKYSSGITRYVRRYLDPHPHPETGDPGELPYDVITELWFDDEAVFRVTLRYLTRTIMPDDVVADECNLFDRSSFRIATVVECDG